jgi:hypothetical protein
MNACLLRFFSALTLTLEVIYPLISNTKILKEVIYKGESWNMLTMRLVVVKLALFKFCSDFHSPHIAMTPKVRNAET